MTELKESPQQQTCEDKNNRELQAAPAGAGSMLWLGKCVSTSANIRVTHYVRAIKLKVNMIKIQQPSDNTS